MSIVRYIDTLAIYDARLTLLGLLLPGLPPGSSGSGVGGGVPWSSKHLVSYVNWAASRAV